MTILRKILGKSYRKSYAQSGEDLIVETVLGKIGIQQPSYLEVGAYHPVQLSNTYLFYKKGGHGVCIEPDPVLCAAIKKKRKRDVCLNIGIGVSEKKQADFYVMSVRVLNTFSSEEAEQVQQNGRHRIEKVIQIPLMPINVIIRQYFSDGPNFVSLDAEGMNFDILATFDFAQFRPEVFCVETLTYDYNRSNQKKISEITDLMKENGYFVFADTYVNTIYIDQNAWNRNKNRGFK